MAQLIACGAMLRIFMQEREILEFGRPVCRNYSRRRKDAI